VPKTHQTETGILVLCHIHIFIDISPVIVDPHQHFQNCLISSSV